MRTGQCLVIAALGTLLLLNGLVSADEMYITTTRVFLEMDKTPFHTPSQLTMSCYGFACENWDCKGSRDNRDPALYASDLVFSFHASCPDYGCRIFDPYYHTERLKIDHCDMTVTADDQVYLISNFSNVPNPSCDWLEMVDDPGNGSYLKPNEKSADCILAVWNDSDLCDKYLANCDDLSLDVNRECGSTVINGSYVRRTPEYDRCIRERDATRREKTESCKQYFDVVNESAVILDESGNPAQRSCELRLAISSAKSIPLIFDGNAGLPQDTGSPVTSLYCSFLSLFGARC